MLFGIATALEKARKALASRHLFDNWPSLLIKYALLRLASMPSLPPRFVAAPLR